MINKRNWIRLTVLLLITIASSILLINFEIIDIDKIKIQENNFQYNAISISAIIGGFLFTGISILISAIDKDRIKRLWENNYLDNLYRAAFIGMIANVATILSAFIVICCNISDKILYYLICIEVLTLIIGIVFFSWCIKQLIFILSKMKHNK